MKTNVKVELPESPILFYSLHLGFLFLIALFAGYLPHANASDRDTYAPVEMTKRLDAERTISSEETTAKNDATQETTNTESETTSNTRSSREPTLRN